MDWEELTINKQHTIFVYNENCKAKYGRYSNGRLAIQYVLESDGSPMAVLTVNIPNEKLGKDEFFIKDWSENEPVAKAAMETGLFLDTGRSVPTGFVRAKIWKFKNE